MTENHFQSQIEIAEAFGVSRSSARKWIENDQFPKKTAHGWPRDGVTAWVAAKNERQQARAEASGDKDEKVRLECERLREVILREKENVKQAKLETKRQSGKLHDVAECDKEWDRAGATLRGAVDSWQAHHVAKNPGARELIDGLCASFLAAMEGVR